MPNKTDIDSIWKALNEEGGVSTVDFKGRKHVDGVKCSFLLAEQKRRIINEACSCTLDLDSLLSKDVMPPHDVAYEVVDPIIDEVDTRLDDSSTGPFQAADCCYSNDSDDDSDANDNDDVPINTDDFVRIKKLIGHLKSDDRSSRVLALMKLRSITKTLANKCQRTVGLDFPPPYDASKIKLDRNLPLVSDLPASVDPHRSELKLDVASQEMSSETAASRSARDQLQTIMDSCGKMLFQLVGDKSEKCRSLSLECMRLLLLAGVDTAKHIPYLVPALASRYVRSGYDKDLEMFIDDDEMHEFYKRGGATDRQDRDGLLSQHSSFKLVEPDEELRLALCRTVESLIIGAAYRDALPLLDAYFSDIVIALQSSLKDPFPDVKIAACRLLVQILRVPQWEAGAKYLATGLARAALPNLRHRKTSVVTGAIDLFEASVCVPDHSKRKGAGTSAITDLVGFREENVLPIAAFYDSAYAVSVNTLAELASHKNARVRERCCEMVSNFLVFLPDRYDHQQRLLPYILSFINDTSSTVQCKALRCIENCGRQYQNEHPDDVIERLQLGIDGDNMIDYDSGLPEPFTCRPSLGARLFIRSNASRFYQAVLGELSNWKGHTRKRSSDLLMVLVVYCEEHLTKDFQSAINSLTKAIEIECSDESDSAHLNTLERLCQIASFVSKYVDPATYLPLLMPRITGDTEGGVHAEKSRHSHLIILSFLIKGASLHRLLPHWQRVLYLLTSDGCIGAFAGTKVQTASLNALSNLMDQVIRKTDMDLLVTHLTETGNEADTCTALNRARGNLHRNRNEVAKDCSDIISLLVSFIEKR